MTLVTTQELCKIIKVDVSWVSRMKNREKNPLSHIPIGKRGARYPLEKVMDWLYAGYGKG